MCVIQTQDLGKTYSNGVTALAGLDLTVSEGEIFGFLGPNGAGKSTTVRLLNGTMRPTSGSVQVLGQGPTSGDIRLQVATMGESARMYETLTVEENLLFFADMYGLSRSEVRPRMEELLERMHLSEKAGLKLGSFSTGMVKRVQLIRVLLHRPRILFLDEPTSGLDPENAREVTALIREVSREEGTTVFLCTHNLPLAETICDRYGFIHRGSLVRTGTLDDLIQASGKPPRLFVDTDAGTLDFPLPGERTGLNPILAGVMAQGRTIRDVRREVLSLEDLYFAFAQEQP